MTDRTKTIRRKMLATGQPARDLEKASRRWSAQEMAEEFTVLGFMAPFVVVTRKSDGKKGTLEFTHSPRWYFGWMED
jgi:hypothetical protein